MVVAIYPGTADGADALLQDLHAARYPHRALAGTTTSITPRCCLRGVEDAAYQPIWCCHQRCDEQRVACSRHEAQRMRDGVPAPPRSSADVAPNVTGRARARVLRMQGVHDPDADRRSRAAAGDCCARRARERAVAGAGIAVRGVAANTSLRLNPATSWTPMIHGDMRLDHHPRRARRRSCAPRAS